MEFLSCAEDEMTARARGWIVEDNATICGKCLAF